MIEVLCFGGAAGCAVVVLFIVFEMIKDGWYAIPNTFNRVVERTVGRRRWKAEREAVEVARRIAWLENCSRQWEELRAQGREMLWSDTFGWIAGADVCPCGYLTECAVWCGDGHSKGGWVFATDGTGCQYRKGECDHDRAYLKIREPHPVIGFVDYRNRPVKNAHEVRPLMTDVKGAGGKYER